MSSQLTVYIGRFSPLHIGHEHVIKTAMANSSHTLILIGSVNKPRTIKDPWTYDERRTMVKAAIESWTDLPEDRRYFIMPLVDEPYNDQLWIRGVQQQVQAAKDAFGLPRDTKVVLTGSKRDWTTYYLDYFPTWEKQFISPQADPYAKEWLNRNEEINSTKVRTALFENPDPIRYQVSAPVLDHIVRFSTTNEYQTLKREYEHIKVYKASWLAAPHPPIFVTVDAVVVQSGHVLLIERIKEPGKGLWALPGGFVEQTETLTEAVLRELDEETTLKVPKPVLLGSLKAREVFDNPGRSLRGRTITHVFLFDLKPAPNTDKLERVKPGDDARDVKWIPIADVENMEAELFEDHHAIIKTMIRRL